MAESQEVCSIVYHKQKNHEGNTFSFEHFMNVFCLSAIRIISTTIIFCCLRFFEFIPHIMLQKLSAYTIIVDMFGSHLRYTSYYTNFISYRYSGWSRLYTGEIFYPFAIQASYYIMYYLYRTSPYSLVYIVMHDSDLSHRSRKCSQTHRTVCRSDTVAKQVPKIPATTGRIHQRRLQSQTEHACLIAKLVFV
ncbi:hypothetical protein AGLY_004835 [Aphis glycines]|uniref:Uncharacterized protein n=1 Tax=Aphis glycines TaxID=307491 RepID=A0A6G0TXF1_APHGL|nr:hypothetical protein AGLY_004835 [Aphis glycines]